MPRSIRFRQIQSRCRDLRRHCLPSVFSATGDYSQRALDRARGYRLLVHAEIESFVEERAFEVGLNATALS